MQIEQASNGFGGGTVDEVLGVVCQDAPRVVALLPCRHLCLCALCAGHRNMRDCPVYRHQIRDRIVLFT